VGSEGAKVKSQGLCSTGFMAIVIRGGKKNTGGAAESAPSKATEIFSKQGDNWEGVSETRGLLLLIAQLRSTMKVLGKRVENRGGKGPMRDEKLGGCLRDPLTSSR